VTDIGAEHGRLDVLINNAAIDYDTWESASDADLTTVREAFEKNVLGTWQTTQALLPLLRRSDRARIVNVSSGAGALTDMGAGIPAYRVSKVALNALALTRRCSTSHLVTSPTCTPSTRSTNSRS
jgi:NAD(P)-dependent dehydrogenase (short-subunit alcohol dehydrogenase family)